MCVHSSFPTFLQNHRTKTVFFNESWECHLITWLQMLGIQVKTTNIVRPVMNLQYMAKLKVTQVNEVLVTFATLHSKVHSSIFHHRSVWQICPESLPASIQYLLAYPLPQQLRITKASNDMSLFHQHHYFCGGACVRKFCKPVMCVYFSNSSKWLSHIINLGVCEFFLQL